MNDNGERIHRVRRVACQAKPTSWLNYSQEAFESGFEAGQSRSLKISPYKHHMLRQFWLSGYEAGYWPERVVSKMRLEGQMPYAIVYVLSEDDPARLAFMIGAAEAVSSPTIGSCPYADAVLREWWLGGYMHMQDPTIALTVLKSELTSIGLGASKVVEEFRDELQRLGLWSAHALPG